MYLTSHKAKPSARLTAVLITSQKVLSGHQISTTMIPSIIPVFRNNFSWGTLDIFGNIIYLYDGNDTVGGALSLREILGLDISGT